MANNPKLKADHDHGTIDHINDLAVRISRLEQEQFGKVYESSHADPAVLEVEKNGLDTPVAEDHAAKFEAGDKVKFIHAHHHDKTYTIKDVSKEDFPGEPFYYSLEELNGVFGEDALGFETPRELPLGNAGDGGEHRADHQNTGDGYNDKTDGAVETDQERFDRVDRLNSQDSAVEVAGGNKTAEEMKLD